MDCLHLYVNTSPQPHTNQLESRLETRLCKFCCMHASNMPQQALQSPARL